MPPYPPLYTVVHTQHASLPVCTPWYTQHASYYTINPVMRLSGASLSSINPVMRLSGASLLSVIPGYEALGSLLSWLFLVNEALGSLFSLLFPVNEALGSLSSLLFRLMRLSGASLVLFPVISCICLPPTVCRWYLLPYALLSPVSLLVGTVCAPYYHPFHWWSVRKRPPFTRFTVGLASQLPSVSLLG